MRYLSRTAAALRRRLRRRRALTAAPIPVQVQQDESSAKILLEDKEIFFRGRALDAASCGNADFALIALQVIAMSKGKNFRLDAPVTQSAWQAARRYELLLRTIAPSEVFPGRVDCPQVIPEQPMEQPGKRVICFSGGVDSTFALLRHAAHYDEAILLHGADYPVDEHAGFADLTARSRRIAQHFAIDLRVVETNLRAHMRGWGLFHTGLLLAALRFQTGGQGQVAWAGDDTPLQEAITFPSGNIVAFGEALSTPILTVRQLDTTIYRSEKLLCLTREVPALLSDISLCYISHKTAGNCGHCRKCTWDRLRLQAIGDPSLRQKAEATLFGSHCDPLQLLAAVPRPVSSRQARSDLLSQDDIGQQLRSGAVHDALQKRRDMLLRDFF